MKEKETFANSKNGGGGFIKKRKKAFTLIELLAIIVILAIIAVITVPIILNIIENSKKGTAIDSAYGYKDAVNKAYIQELSKPNQESLKLNGTYEVQSDGTLKPATGSTFGIATANYALPVSVSGDKPTSGSLTYDNNVLKSGTLIIGDYTATYSNGSFTAVKAGSSSSQQSGNEQVAETWDRYYYYDSANSTTANTTEFNTSWIVWGQENDTNGRKEVCGKYTINENNYISCLRFVSYDEEYLDSVTVDELGNYSANEGSYVAIKNTEFINNGLDLTMFDDDGTQYLFSDTNTNYSVWFAINEHNEYSEVEIQNIRCSIGWEWSTFGFYCTSTSQ